ncbi:hypothetical protein HanIR_Chr14g0709541 [Helianthus annuus]|nr:hypothetical protein HanIR_Chr14g0709541 [Helianthus annuus]
MVEWLSGFDVCILPNKFNRQFTMLLLPDSNKFTLHFLNIKKKAFFIYMSMQFILRSYYE